LWQMAGFPSFSWLNYIPLNIYKYTHIYLLHSPIDRHLGCLHIFAIVNNAGINIGVWVSLQDNSFISFRYISEVGLLDHVVILFLIF